MGLSTSTLHRDVDEKIKNSPNILVKQSMEQEELQYLKSSLTSLVYRKRLLRRKLQDGREHGSSSCTGQHRKRSQNVPEDNSYVFEGVCFIIVYHLCFTL
jgi:hypothetical protein